MKSYIIVLSSIFLVYSVSADWKDDVRKEYITNMETFIDGEIEMKEAMQRRRGVGADCLVTEKHQLGKIMDPYHTKIENCVRHDINRVFARSCADYQQSLTAKEVQNISQETIKCINNEIERSSPKTR